MEEKEVKKGISFQRLVPFLSMEFKQQLANGDLEIKRFFNLHSDKSYQALLAVIKDDVLINGKVITPKKEGSLYIAIKKILKTK